MHTNTHTFELWSWRCWTLHIQTRKRNRLISTVSCSVGRQATKYAHNIHELAIHPSKKCDSCHNYERKWTYTHTNVCTFYYWGVICCYVTQCMAATTAVCTSYGPVSCFVAPGDVSADDDAVLYPRSRMNVYEFPNAVERYGWWNL